MMMEIERSKRKRPAGRTKHTKKVARRTAPRRTGVIPGLLMQTNTEKKVLFTGTFSLGIALAMNTTGTIQAINLIQVGSSMFNRVGRKIEMRSIRLVCNIQTLNVTRATIQPTLGRIMIIYDRQTNGANPALADFLQDTDQTGANTTNAYSGLNMNNRERFVTLLDKKINLPQATCTAGVMTNVFPNGEPIPETFDEFRRLKGLTTHFKADSNPAVIGDIATGGLFILSLAEDPAGTELYQYSWNVRLKYVDV